MTIDDWHRHFALATLFVMLVVLVIFIAMTPRGFAARVAVDLPEARARMPLHEEKFAVSVPRSDGLVYVGHQVMRFGDLERGLATLPMPRSAPLQLRIGRDVPYGDVRRVVLAAQNAGYTRVTFVVRRREGAGGFTVSYTWD